MIKDRLPIMDMVYIGSKPRIALNAQRKEDWYEEMISANSRTPPSDYTDKQWQIDFLQLKQQVRPSSEKHMPVLVEPKFTNRTYHGKTQWHCYCDFINDILKNIRNGEVDYCFFIYQIAELLQFEHNRLSARWLSKDRCFQVYLNSQF